MTEEFRTFGYEDMVMVEKKRKSGNLRTEVFAMRLDPKLKYLAEIGARKQRRSLANFIEWAIEVGLKHVDLSENSQYSKTVLDQSGELWDIEEAERFIKLAFIAPDLLTYDEQILWKIICETGHVWKGDHNNDGDWQWKITIKNLNLDRLRKHWEDFKKVANGEADRSILPVTLKKESEDNDTPF